MLRKISQLLTTVAALAACDCGPTMPNRPPPGPPVVTLSAPSSNVIGQKVTVNITVTACETVEQVQVFQGETFVRGAPYAGPSTRVELPASDFNNYYPTLGIQADLTLKAKAVCADGRLGTSQPVSVRFFPVASVLSTGQLTMPDSFVAEGGAGGTPVTFVGCANLDVGLRIVRVDTLGNVLQQSDALPFPCTVNSVITDKEPTSSTRWLWEPGVGAVAFVSAFGRTMAPADLAPVASFSGKIGLLGVGPDGDALIWEEEQFSNPNFYRIGVSSGVGNTNNKKWFNRIAGIPNATPLVDASGRIVVGKWNGTIGTYTGSVYTELYNYNTGGLLSTYELTSLSYGDLNAPVVPRSVFNAEGTRVYFPYQTGGPANASGVMACAVESPAGCQAQWQSPLVDAVIKDLVLLRGGAQIAIVNDVATWFISTADGSVTSIHNAAIRTSGSLVSIGAQVGSKADFYLLNGPQGGFPTEIVAIDSPQQGEVWRYGMNGGGGIPSASLTMAIDDTGQPWVRVGLDQVKPLGNADYRAIRGPTPPPP